MFKNNKLKQNPKKQFRKKFIIYLVLILVLLIIGVVSYFKSHKYLTASFDYSKPNSSRVINKLNNNESIFSELTTDESKSINLLHEMLKKLTGFQSDITHKVSSLEQEIKSHINTNEKAELLSKITSLEKQISLLSSKKDYIKNFTIFYNFILAIKSNTPFLGELDAFKNTFLVQNYTNEVESLSAVANKGIPSSYDLVCDLDLLFPNLKTDVYKLDNSTLGKFKYYISYIFLIRKDSSTIGDKSIDSIVYDIKTALFSNSPEKALAIVENNNLQSLNILDSWYINLSYRVKANILVTKLQQYLISTNNGL